MQGLSDSQFVNLSLPAPSNQVWVLADGDAFYASCEVARRPHLKGKIVIVKRLDKCMACTYEGKKLGISIATPLREVKRMLKNTEHYIFTGDMGYYDRVSQQVFSLIEECSGGMEKFSVDECFFNWTGIAGTTDEEVHDYARKMQDYILQATGMPITFGFARTKLVAKMFCKFNKPYGVFGSLDQNKIAEALAPLPLIAIPFIGKKRSTYLPRVNTVGEFMETEGAAVRQKLKRDGLKLWLELHGYNALIILRKGGPSCIGRTKSFHPHFTTDTKVLWRRLMVKFEEAYAQLIQDKVATKYIGAGLRPMDLSLERDFRKTRLIQHTSERTCLINTLKALFHGAYREGRMYRGVGLTFSELTYQENREMSLFDFDHTRREREHSEESIQHAIESINNTLGGRHVVRASSLDAIKKMQGDEFGLKIKVQ